MTPLGPGCWSAPVAVFTRRARGSASKPLPTAGPGERVRAAGVSATGTLPPTPVFLLGGMMDVDADDDDDGADEDVHDSADEEHRGCNTSAPLPGAPDVACRLCGHRGCRHPLIVQ